MAWIKSYKSMSTLPKVRRAARKLGISVPTMIGHIHLLWYWALDYASDGDLSGYDSLDISEAAQWNGDPDEFIEALINAGPGDEPGFLERNGEIEPANNTKIGSLVIHGWRGYDHQ